ncbi:MAG TPA: hypothetical protein VKY27_04035 [Bacteriovoracaceae bacterium]|nr:hypothetical protein [Bacteriovoracaceae bacterium]
MKLNLWLFIVLIALLIGTYFFQEKRVEENFKQSLIANRVITEEIVLIETKDFRAQKVDEQWKNGDELLSHNDLTRLVRMLKNLKEVRKVEGEVEVKGPSFKVNEVNYTLGELNLDKSAFYLKKDEDVYLAVIDTETTQIHTHEDNLNELKLDELKGLLSKTNQELLERQLFRYYPKLEYESVAIKPDGALDFELDFKRNATLPPPMKGIEVHEDLAGKFRSLITQINIKRKIKADPKLKKNKLGEMTFYPSELKWEIYLPYKDKADAFLFDSEGNAYEAIGGTLRVFLIQLQDYWDKKIIPPSEFKNFDSLNVTFYQGPEELSITVKNREPLEFISEQPLNEEKVQELFQVIFNLSNYDQGQRVSNLTTSQLRQILSEDNLRLDVMGQELSIVSYGQEIIVANITHEYKVHFLRSENFPLTLKDMLK